MDDLNAPVVARTDFDVTHPYRQKEVIRAINEQIGSSVVNSRDVWAVRKAHPIDGQPRYFHKPKFGSPQYSQAFVDWLVSQYKKNPTFHQEARAKAQSL